MKWNASSLFPDEPSGSRSERRNRNLLVALSSKPLLWRMGATLLILAIAFGAGLVLRETLADRVPFAFFLPAVLAGALLSGLPGGLLTAIGASVLIYLPFGGLRIATLDQATNPIPLFVFGVNCLMVSALGSLLRDLSRTRQAAARK